MTNNDDNGKAAGATICVRCKHMETTMIFDVMYVDCDTNPRVDYVTGELMNRTCSIKNPKGQCPDYEERGD